MPYRPKFLTPKQPLLIRALDSLYQIFAKAHNHEQQPQPQANPVANTIIRIVPSYIETAVRPLYSAMDHLLHHKAPVTDFQLISSIKSALTTRPTLPDQSPIDLPIETFQQMKTVADKIISSDLLPDTKEWPAEALKDVAQRFIQHFIEYTTDATNHIPRQKFAELPLIKFDYMK